VLPNLAGNLLSPSELPMGERINELCHSSSSLKSGLRDGLVEETNA
jgi:hypothetical protein